MIAVVIGRSPDQFSGRMKQRYWLDVAPRVELLSSCKTLLFITAFIFAFIGLLANRRRPPAEGSRHVLANNVTGTLSV